MYPYIDSIFLIQGAENDSLEKGLISIPGDPENERDTEISLALGDNIIQTDENSVHTINTSINVDTPAIVNTPTFVNTPTSVNTPIPADNIVAVVKC